MLAQQNAESWDAPAVPLGPCCTAVLDPLCIVPTAEGDPSTNMILGGAFTLIYHWGGVEVLLRPIVV